MPDVSVIVVSHNCRDELRRCISSIPKDCKVIVIDNASEDGTANMIASDFPLVSLIRNPTNRGFGSANNQGLDRVTTEYALFLNPDANAREKAIETLAAFLDEHQKAVACGGTLVFPDGRLQESACKRLSLWAVFCEQLYFEKLFPRSRVFSPYWVSGKHRSTEPLRVAQVMGACLMMRKVNGEFLRFDERFFLYCEDTDLCKRLSEFGEIWYVPHATFTHCLGASSNQNRWLAIAYYNRGKELYFRIHHGIVASSVCFLLNRLGAMLRLIVWSLTTIATLGLVSRFRRRVPLFLRVLFAPVDPYKVRRS